MKKGTLLFALLLCAVFFSTNYGIASTVPNNEASNFIEVYGGDKKGVVTFDHGEHARIMGVCTNCHDALKNAGGEVNRKVGHTFCKQCHKDVGSLRPNAPVRCGGCHVR